MRPATRCSPTRCSSWHVARSPTAPRMSTRRWLRRRRCWPRRRASSARAAAQRTIGKLLAMRGDGRGGAGSTVAAGNEGMPRGRSARRSRSRIARSWRSSRSAREHATSPRTHSAPASSSSSASAISATAGTTALMLVDLLAAPGRVRRGGPLVCRRARDAERGRPHRCDRCRFAGGVPRSEKRRHGEGDRLSARAVEVASTIDMYEPKALAYEWHARTLALVGKPHEAREAAADRARDLRGQG